jgi:hypothetical protein
MTRPVPLGDARDHLTLMRTMAAEVGADMGRAFADGEIDAEEWGEAVTRCRGCGWVEGCRAWLARPEDRPRTVPEGCANARLMRALRLPG